MKIRNSVESSFPNQKLWLSSLVPTLVSTCYFQSSSKKAVDKYEDYSIYQCLALIQGEMWFQYTESLGGIRCSKCSWQLHGTWLLTGDKPWQGSSQGLQICTNSCLIKWDVTPQQPLSSCQYNSKVLWDVMAFLCLMMTGSIGFACHIQTIHFSGEYIYLFLWYLLQSFLLIYLFHLSFISSRSSPCVFFFLNLFPRFLLLLISFSTSVCYFSELILFAAFFSLSFNMYVKKTWSHPLTL